MGGPTFLTKEREEELIRRRKLGIRCDAWLANNNQRAIARMYGISSKRVSHINKGKDCSLLEEDEVKEVRRLARHSARVFEIRKRNCRSQLKKEFAVSEERIDKLCPPPAKVIQTRQSAAERFLTMKLTASPSNDWIYYGRVAC